MDRERFEEKCVTAAAIDADESCEVIELTPDQLGYVAGGLGVASNVGRGLAVNRCEAFRR